MFDADRPSCSFVDDADKHCCRPAEFEVTIRSGGVLNVQYTCRAHVAWMKPPEVPLVDFVARRLSVPGSGV